MKRTASGFEYEVSPDAFDNWELLEDLVDLEENSTKVVPVCRRLLGKDGAESLKEYCRDENGKVLISKMQDEIADIIRGLGEDDKGKN